MFVFLLNKVIKSDKGQQVLLEKKALETTVGAVLPTQYRADEY